MEPLRSHAQLKVRHCLDALHTTRSPLVRSMLRVLFCKYIKIQEARASYEESQSATTETQKTYAEDIKKKHKVQ